MTQRLHYLHPFLIAIAPAIFIWGRSFSEVQWREIVPALALLLAFAGIVFSACTFLYRDSRKGALLASLFLLLTLSHRYVYLNPLLWSFMRHRYGLLLTIVLIIIVGYALKKKNKTFTAPNQIITAIASFFILLSLLQALTHLPTGRGYAESALSAEIGTTGQESAGKELRDIYYIILDAYEAPKIIAEKTGYQEAEEILDWLEERGFFVARESKSNYLDTKLSLPSFLNMRYLTPEEFASPLLRRRMIQNKTVAAMLQGRGYRYINAGADWITYFDAHADENIYIGFSPYQKTLWESTAFFALIESERWGLERAARRYLGLHSLDPRLRQWEREQFKLAALAQIPKRKEPTFVFAHFFLPHTPLVFNADGTYVTRKAETAKTWEEKFTGQVAFTNNQIKRLVAALVENSEPKPIIILQADHGFEFVTYAGERFPIFNVFYFPDGKYTALYNSISPVNAFRVVFNQYFDQTLELLPDESYISDPKDASRALLFTEELKGVTVSPKDLDH